MIDLKDMTASANPTKRLVQCECGKVHGSAEVGLIERRNMLVYTLLAGTIYIGRSNLVYCAACKKPVLIAEVSS